MSDSPDRFWLFRLTHMIAAIKEIQLYTKDKTATSFKADRMTVRSVERCFEILGEAARKIPKEVQQELADIPWARITGLRNILAHDYDETSADILWKTIELDLPDLLIILEKTNATLVREAP
jgi:uncharacterized protein with HEPN domain